MVQFKTVQYGREVEVIGVIADTHIPTRGRTLPPAIFNLFKEVQLILHAGDLVDEQIIDQLSTLAPVEAVAGNMDPIRLQSRLGRLKFIKIGDVGIGMLHGDLGGRNINFDQAKEFFKPEEPQTIVFGHLHEPVNKVHNGTLYFNPGSLIEPRRSPLPSCGILRIDGLQVSGEIICLDYE